LKNACTHGGRKIKQVLAKYEAQEILKFFIFLEIGSKALNK
jgi:hypothetical protein